MRRVVGVVALWCAASCGTSSPSKPDVMTVADIASFSAPPGVRIAYGLHPLQFGELRVPTGPGPHPVAVLIHGGCWLSAYDLVHCGPLAQALADEGIATWTIEYRRVGNDGGGWPGTFRDVANGTDRVGDFAAQHNLDLDRVIAIGHSAGGQLALWLAARARLPKTSELYSPDPLTLSGVLALAPAADLAHLHATGVCGNVVDALMGGAPGEVPQRYAHGSPTQLVPNVRQIVLLGAHDTSWTPVGERYEAAARAAGARISRVDAPESGHFEMIDPTSTTWPLVRDAAGELVGLRFSS